MGYRMPDGLQAKESISESLNFVGFLGAVGGVVRLLGTPLRENCRASLAGMASSKSEGKAEALGITGKFQAVSDAFS